MTREEIIKGLQFTIDMFLLDPTTGETYTEPRNDMDKTTIDSCRSAIKLLEQELKTGHWINIDATHSKCDRCGAIFEITSKNGEANYCPNCGAKTGRK